MPTVVRITDVSPRDGLQNEPGAVPTDDKVRLVRLLEAAGADEIEVGSFVSPKWVPQLADTAELLARLAPTKADGVVYSVLVPNEKGLDAALEVNRRHGGSLIDKVSVFTAASETFCQRNTNAGFDVTLKRFAPVVRRAHAAGLLVRGYLSCVIACPFEGVMPPADVAEAAGRLVDVGIDELDLGDTIGAAEPGTIRRLLETLWLRLDPAWARPARTTLHLHDTRGTAASCVPVALELGIRSFDGAAGGLGGCPYASTPGARAPGNIDTQTLAHAIDRAGFSTRLDAGELGEAGRFAASLAAAARAGTGGGGGGGGA